MANHNFSPLLARDRLRKNCLAIVKELIASGTKQHDAITTLILKRPLCRNQYSAFYKGIKTLRDFGFARALLDSCNGDAPNIGQVSLEATAVHHARHSCYTRNF